MITVVNHFADGTTRKDTEGVVVPYTKDTAAAYTAVKRIAETLTEDKQRST